MKNCLLLAILIMVSGLLLFGVARATPQENPHQNMQMQDQPMTQQIKVGKTGEVKFDQETKIGDLVLAPGNYRLVHRAEGEDHFVRFTRVKDNVQLGEVKCRLEPLGKKVSLTAISIRDEGGARRIVRIEVAGENVAHIF